MDLAAKVTSKGQITIPKAVRDKLGIAEGDEIVFRVEENRAMAFDYYVFVRDAYRDLRENLVKDGETRQTEAEEDDLYFPETQ